MSNDYKIYSFATQFRIRQLIERGRTNFSRSELFAEIAPTTEEQKSGFSWGVRTLSNLFSTDGKGNYTVKVEGQS